MSLGPLMIDLAGTELLAEERELLRHPLVGGVILFTRNYLDPQQLTTLVSSIHAVRSPPLIVAVDQEGGRVQRFRTGFSLLPPARRIGHEFDLDARAGCTLARVLGWLMAAELRSHAVDISFAPCVDLDLGVSEVIGERAFHADPAAVGQLAAAWVHGMREAGPAEYGEGTTLTETASQIGAQFKVPALRVLGDLTKADEVERVAATVTAELGPIDILVHNAGGDIAAAGGKPNPNDAVLIKEEDVRAVLDRNLLSTIFVCREVARRMMERRTGRIVTISSIAALSMGRPG